MPPANALAEGVLWSNLVVIVVVNLSIHIVSVLWELSDKALPYESKRRRRSTAFNPPNAKELEIATRTGFSRAVLGT